MFRSDADKSLQSLLTKESKAAALALFALLQLSFSLAINDEKRLRTGLVTNSLAGTYTQKLLATRLSFPFSI
jgi:hypothetical protein